MKRTGPDAATLALVKARQDGSCLRCGARGEQCHHRTPRGMGGTSDAAINRAPNLVWVCQPCHTEIESHRLASYRSGWLVRRGADPASQPLLTLHNTMLILLPDGGMVSNPLADLNDQSPWSDAS